jgi:hypothetical protein
VKNLVVAFRTMGRILLMGLFCLSVLFWASLAFYCIRGFAVEGVSGVTGWLQHIAAQPSEVSQVPAVPDWNTIALRLAGVAVITLGLWFANRHTLARFRHEVQGYFRSLRNLPSPR